MQVRIYGKSNETNILLEKVNLVLQELGLNDFINCEISIDENLKSELNITQEPALIIEEESIEFKDMIFEGIVPEIEELKIMFLSIIGNGNFEGCDGASCGHSCNCC